MRPSRRGSFDARLPRVTSTRRAWNVNGIIDAFQFLALGRRGKADSPPRRVKDCRVSDHHGVPEARAVSPPI